MIDLDKPEDVEALLVRVQARRVALFAGMAGQPIPAGASRILRAWDSWDADLAALRLDADTIAYAAWCERHGVEVVEMLGSGEFWFRDAVTVGATSSERVH